MTDGDQVEHFVVLSACGEHGAIVQSRCLGLTGTDIHIHTYVCTYIRTGDDYASRLLASPLARQLKVMQVNCTLIIGCTIQSLFHD